MNDFDPAAKNAEADLDLLDFEKLSASALSRWFAKNYMAAGHKRLGRILVKRAKLAEALAA